MAVVPVDWGEGGKGKPLCGRRANRKNFELIGLLRFHGAMTALIEFGADRIGKNFPDHPADEFFLALSGQFENALVHVSVAPVAIEDGESVADAGEGGFALVEQIADG